MDNKYVKLLLWALLLLSVLVSLAAAYKRISIESTTPSVELVFDLDDVRKISLRDGISKDIIFSKLKEAGITTIAVNEDTLESLELEGRLAWITGYEQDTLYKISKATPSSGKLNNKAKIKSRSFVKTALRNSRPNPNFSYAVTGDQELQKRILRELSSTLGPSRVRKIAKDTIEIADDEEDLINLGVGIDPDKVAYVRKIGFLVVPRVKNNYRFAQGPGLLKLLSLRSEGDFRHMIFDGEEVMGYKSNIRATARNMKCLGIRFGYIEMSEQKGDKDLLSKMGEEIVRVHSISQDEMNKKLSRPEAIDRFELAVSERGVRMLFIRPFLMPEDSEKILTTNYRYISELSSALKRSGTVPGAVEDTKELKIKLAAIALISLGIGIGALFLINSFIRVPVWAAFLFLLLFEAAPFVFNEAGMLLTFRKLAALLSAIVFPSLAVVAVFKNSRPTGTTMIPVSRAILMVLSVFAISMTGAVFIVGMLADSLFMVGAQQFAGIKFAFVAPLAIALVHSLVVESGDLRSAWKRILGMLNSPITALWVVLAAFGGGIAALYLLRSGNFGIGVLDIERVARSLLEDMLAVRPRTKEFLIGYPALFLAAVYYIKGGRKWLWLLLTIGIIGPISTVNTYCHIHSPVLVSLIRSFYGVLLGIAVGALYYAGSLAARMPFRK